MRITNIAINTKKKPIYNHCEIKDENYTIYNWLLDNTLFFMVETKETTRLDVNLQIKGNSLIMAANKETEGCLFITTTQEDGLVNLERFDRWIFVCLYFL